MFNRLDIAAVTVDPDRHLDGKIEIYGTGVIVLFSDGPWARRSRLTFLTHAHHLITALQRLSLPAPDQHNAAGGLVGFVHRQLGLGQQPERQAVRAGNGLGEGRRLGWCGWCVPGSAGCGGALDGSG